MADHSRRRNARKQHFFQKDCTYCSCSVITAVKLLMYAFGDDPNPAPESVSVLEDIMTEYINEMCLEAARIAAPRHKLKVDDFKIALRHDQRKLGRIEELLYLQKVIAEARKQFDTDEGIQGRA